MHSFFPQSMHTIGSTHRIIHKLKVVKKLSKSRNQTNQSNCKKGLNHFSLNYFSYQTTHSTYFILFLQKITKIVKWVWLLIKLPTRREKNELVKWRRQIRLIWMLMRRERLNQPFFFPHHEPTWKLKKFPPSSPPFLHPSHHHFTKNFSL